MNDFDKEAWSQLYLIEHGSNIGVLVSKFLAHGTRGIDSLRRLISLQRITMLPEDMGRLFLPWYRESDLGDGAWWNWQTQPLTVGDWEALKEKAPQYENVKKFAAVDLSKLGPSFVVTDTTFGISIVVDGCKRLCAAYLLYCSQEVLRLQSPVAHVLYSTDFLNHLMRKISHENMDDLFR